MTNCQVRNCKAGEISKIIEKNNIFGLLVLKILYSKPHKHYGKYPNGCFLGSCRIQNVSQNAYYRNSYKF